MEPKTYGAGSIILTGLGLLVYEGIIPVYMLVQSEPVNPTAVAFVFFAGALMLLLNGLYELLRPHAWGGGDLKW